MSAGAWAGAAAGLLVLVALFMTWYEPGVSGWEAFSVADVIFAIAAVLALASWVALARSRSNPTAVAWQSLSLLAALVATAVVLYRTLSPPGDGEVERALGSWLGLAGVLGVLAGTVAAMRDEGRARRTPEAERRAAAEALERAELLELPGDGSAGAPSR